MWVFLTVRACNGLFNSLTLTLRTWLQCLNQQQEKKTKVKTECADSFDEIDSNCRS